MKMHEINMEYLDQLILDGRSAAQYAWDHYEELIAREAVYTLYGPKDYGIGAAMPGKFISKRSRKLTKQTRRKDYIIYELDSNYKLLRTILMRNYTEVEHIYHCFELNGIQYACPFYGAQKKVLRKEVLAVGYSDAKPCFLGFLSEHSLVAQFFDYPSHDKMIVTTYSYSKVSKYSSHGYPVDYSAPIGTLNSPVNCGTWEEEMTDTDFSKWFS